MTCSSQSSLTEVDTLLSWLCECTEHHSFCKSASKPALPKRVVNVARLDKIFLYESKGSRGEYLALSYCWGKQRHTDMMLFGTGSKGKKGQPDPKPNIERHMTQIPYDKMPKTLRDAVDITHRLGYQYLWIDSLCIVQGDEREWRDEHPTLGAIYSNARLVLAASSAKDMEEGFLGKIRIPRAPRGTGIPNNTRDSLIRCSPPLTLWDEPLNRRAWALSEAIFSNRIVHFTSGGMIWECNEVRRDVAGRARLVNEHDPDCFRIFRNVETALNCDGIHLYNKWNIVVEYFTQRQINSQLQARDKDPQRLTALDRVAMKFSEILWQVFGRHDVYLAGIWEGDLPRSLLWSVEKRVIEGASPGWRRPDTHRAPTWSWASIEGPVCFERLHNFYSSIDSIKTMIVPPDGSQQWGQMLHGKLVIRGKALHGLQAVPVSSICPDQSAKYYAMVHVPDTDISCRFVADIPLTGHVEYQGLSCIYLGSGTLVRESASEERLYEAILLLRHPKGAHRVFERVGISSRMVGEAWDALIGKMKDDIVTIR